MRPSGEIRSLERVFTADYIHEASTTMREYADSLKEALNSPNAKERKRAFASKKLAQVFDAVDKKGLYNTSKLLGANRNSYEAKIFAGLASVLVGKDISLLQVRIPFVDDKDTKTNLAFKLFPMLTALRGLTNLCFASFMWQFVKSDQFKKNLSENYMRMSELDYLFDGCDSCPKSQEINEQRINSFCVGIQESPQVLQEGIIDSIKKVYACVKAMDGFITKTTGYDLETIKIVQSDLKSNPAWGKVCMLLYGIMLCIAAIAASLVGASAVCAVFTGGACGAFGVWVTGVVLSVVGSQGWKYGSIALKKAACHPNCTDDDLGPLPPLKLSSG